MSAAVAVSQLAEDNAGHLNGKESCLGVVPSFPPPPPQMSKQFYRPVFSMCDVPVLES